MDAGIKSLSIDGEKSTLTVVGDVDPVCIISALKKKKKHARIESVGPYKIPDELLKKKILCCTSCSRGPYRPAPYGTVVWHEESQYGGCIIS
ncbi:Heavy-metal-associated domain-containing protein [Carex littledalei]|uniref:Heavy-metal-associated domain-containing protein n=1 Tax=Carex littledalei TaxID=544730 RepID=A0A833QPU4_9POAL|nr:Heavy-metal-associated domain-containing protein [Carex littledalei]